MRNGAPSHQPAVKVAANHEEDPFESLEEIEAKTIGNLLPDEDDLFSGVIDELGLDTPANRGDELEEFDLFSSCGGLELEGDDRLGVGQRNIDLVGASNGSIVGEHPYGEHPSRTLFVRNINSSVEDSELKALFEQYGDIRTLYTACKHRGFVMISYYDIRAARNAMRVLQNKPLRRRKLDIHYSIPKDNPSEKDVNQGTLVVFNLDSSVSTDELQRIFGGFGEIKEIRETPHKQNHKFIEFYDVRAADAALHALNRSDIAGKQIKLEPSRPGGVRRFVQQSDQEQDDSNLCESPFDDFMAGQIAITGVSASGYMDNGSASVLQNVIESPVNTFIEPNRTSSVPINLPSPARVASISNQYNLQEPNQSVDEMKFGGHSISSFHPHSFPEYHDNLAKSLPSNSSSTIPEMVGGLGPRITDGLDNRHIRGVSTNGHRIEPSGGVFGSPSNGSQSLHGNHYAWNNSNSHHQHPPSAMIWPNSPSFVNGIHANRLQQIPAFPRVPPVMLNAVSPVHHHIGSAPPVNSPFWDRRHAYAGESPDTGFHLGSLGNIAFPGSSPSHAVEIASHSIFSHAAGSNGVVHSPQQMCHLLPGRNPVISMPGSFESPNERVRNFSHRRNESNPNNADKKQYELDIDRIIHGEDSRTTLMIKNIPNKYTSKMLLAAIDEHCRGTYDFIYLPIDFKNKCNVGYAFINMIDPQQIIPFYKWHSVKQIPAVVELCIQAGVDIEKYPTKRRTKPVYCIEGRIVDFESDMGNDEMGMKLSSQKLDPSPDSYNVPNRGELIGNSDSQVRDDRSNNTNNQGKNLTELSIMTMGSWFEMVAGVKKIMEKYSVWTCGYCPEVQVGPKGHKVRMCKATKHQSRNGLHAWQEATIDDLVGPNYVWHVRDPNGPPLHNNLKRYYGKAPAVVELFVQAGAPIPDQYKSMMRLDVVTPERDEVDLVA
ncbi:hypothetical protein SLEP1_g27939 [Rubroshorea leprosula]|uniref:Uncharacterized protein n=1 Tax=Rubroshorea leprosula TaxID=152421 RepID=A0AAV5K4L1_9ROSI|nr:hypothetical protein SLEP1_g27939 [Rubroshorea leprosula]